jgi:hypothetical protein
MIEKIIDLIINNFDFSFMITINGLTYFIIKIIDDMNGKKKVPAWQKRLVLVVCIGIITAVYIEIGYSDIKMLLNSAILAPVFWKWLAAPICDKLGINYRKVDKAIDDKSE